MKLQPLKNRVIVQLSEQETKSRGGIIIPDIAKKRPVTGTVMEVGPEVDQLEPGDQVLMVNGAGREMEYQEVKAVLLTDEEILCKFKYD